MNLCYVVAVALAVFTAHRANGVPGLGVDTGVSGSGVGSIAGDLSLTPLALRIRLPAEGVSEITRENCRPISKAVRSVLLVLPGQISHSGNARSRGSLPVDLRQAFRLGYATASNCEDVVLEIGNEPDLSFVPENAEAYVSYLKAVYIGYRSGRAIPMNIDARNILVAGFGLPPGPYFQSFMANGGLSYTDGFNFHFYGYAEDFSGVFRQFEAAAAELGSAGEAEASVWTSNFYPSADGWIAKQTATFDFPLAIAESTAEALLKRPRAEEEPELKQQGRWLLSDGVSVREQDGEWEFTIDHWPVGPLRAPMAELPLPPGWTIPPESLVSFQYRADTPANATPSSAAIDPGRVAAGTIERRRAATLPMPTGLESEPAAPPVSTSHRVGTSVLSIRSLPVFMTEYGYGGLDKVTRNTAEGRERQRRWFSAVDTQVRNLGVEGAMAFVLPPYLERNLSEFGLLSERSVPAIDDSKPPRKIGPYYSTPAFDELLKNGNQPTVPRRWAIAAPPPSPIVIDFIAGKGLGQAKSYSGYFLVHEAGRSFPGEGDLVIYNFDDKPVTGTLRLEGDAWELAQKSAQEADSLRSERMTLRPMERRVVPVWVRPRVTRFVACPVTAKFFTERGAHPVASPESPGEAKPDTIAPTAPMPIAQAVTPAPPKGPWQMFECYFRTENGNLYQTWPRLLPTKDWQTYMQRAENFTMAFYGRANLPWRFMDNRPASLVFFFHPDAFPVTYQVRGARLARFSAP